MDNLLQSNQSVEIDGAHYSFSIDRRGRARIDRCRSECARLRIPETLSGCPVTSIGEAAFAKLACVENVECPCCLLHIGRHAFEGCLRLRSIALNAGLRSIGEEAFFLCKSLDGLSVPSSVERFGPHPLGAAMPRRARKSLPFEISFSPDSETLFFDGRGVLYERSDDGLVLVDGYGFDGSELVCDPETVEIGPRALSHMNGLSSIKLPHGLKRIGAEAFRGSTGLSSVNLPDTLESIGDAAFSGTKLASLRIPASCTNVSDTAFAFGAIANDGSVCAYRSHLATIAVDPGNAVFCVKGGVLCRRDGSALEALLAPAAADCITLDQSVTVVRDTTFAGTTSIGVLEIFDGIAFETDGGVFGDCAIGSIRITGISGDSRPATFSMDFGHGGIDALKDGLSHGSFDARTFAEAYDRIIGQIPDGLTQARLVIGRLASPVHMAEGTAKRFRAYASSQLAAISIAFGQRGEFHLFELMADAGVLDAARIDVCASALSAQGDASALGYLLDMKRRRFKKASWDEYGI